VNTGDLPLLNAILNGTCGCLLILGFYFIKFKKNETAHRKCMVGALIVSALFLTSYLTYHYLHGSTKFTGEGVVRIVYFTILISHTILAVVIVPLIGMTVFRAVRGEFERHRRIARITLPLWLYVSVTGVVVYLMLYQWFPGV
jgi:uncharacterized membrane protein YozB (DUF420 family)